jgi:hypothetical protein
MKACVGGDPNCSDGWVSVIQVHERAPSGTKVVETRPYGADVLGDAEKHADAWAVFDGQVAAEAVQPCRFCRPNWVHPEDRRNEDDLTREATGRVDARRRGNFWDEEDDGPAALGAGS